MRSAVSLDADAQYLLSLKIMHRDVKPSNILLNTSGQVKLCDFGTTLWRTPPDAAGVSAQLDQSITKTYIGTCAYMAPERIMGQPYTSSSEVTVACCAARLFLRHPFRKIVLSCTHSTGVEPGHHRC